MPLLTCTNVPADLPQNEDAIPDTLFRPYGRRGVTAMEYLMALSLIIVVAMIGVGYFGNMTNSSLTATSNSISKSMKKGG
jgi:Tfp pilus assembly protein FimT